MKNIEVSIKQIIDFLFPKLDAYEQMFYMYIFRNTVLENKREILIPVSTIHQKVGFGIGRSGSPVSRGVVRKKLQSLENKGCIKLLKRTRKGILYKFFLPEEIPRLIQSNIKSSDEIDIEKIDFYKIKKNKLVILKRENHKCFYCGKKITEKDFVVDHVTPQMLNGNNSYKNCVACCLDCNSSKQGTNVDDFSRNLYREKLLNKDELDDLLSKIKNLKEGKLKPELTDDKNFTQHGR